MKIINGPNPYTKSQVKKYHVPEIISDTIMKLDCYY